MASPETGLPPPGAAVLVPSLRLPTAPLARSEAVGAVADGKERGERVRRRDQLGVVPVVCCRDWPVHLSLVRVVGEHAPPAPRLGSMPSIRVRRQPWSRLSEERGFTLDATYAANLGRFRHRRPPPPKLPTVA